MPASIRRRVLSLWLVVALVAALAGCGSEVSPSQPGGQGACAPGLQIECACLDGGHGVQICRADGTGFDACMGCTGMQTGAGGSAAASGSGGVGGGPSSSSSSSSSSSGSGLVVEPSNPSLVVELPPIGQTLAFACLDAMTNTPVAATWSTDTEALGTIDAAGVFTPNGAGTGVVQVTCASGADAASTSLTLALHVVDDPNTVSAASQVALEAPGGTPDPGFVLLYPYDQTVFPQGTPPPEIHPVGGTAIGTTYGVHVVVGAFQYDGFFETPGPTPRLIMSDFAWDALTQAASGQTIAVEVSKLVQGQKYGPITESWTIARGSLHGRIYYSTYDSPAAGTNGAVLRLDGASATPEVLIGNCTVCHNVSADGSTLAAANHAGPGGTFDLSAGGLNPPSLWMNAELAAFAAIYPKGGSVLVTNGTPGGAWPPNTPGTSGTWTSSLYTKSGTLIVNSGIESYYAQTPAFSFDGSLLAFVDRSPLQNAGGFWPGTLASMAYDSGSQKFTNYQVLATPPAGRQYAWPAFTPDGALALFQDGVGEDLATWTGNTGKIGAVDLATKIVTPLAKLNGDGYLPQGARDEDKNYEPYVSPVASGGYFWVVFTSRRTYGSVLTGGPEQTKRLWVAALDVNAPPGTDGSHPAFYLSGQELTSGNHRGTFSLAACKENGIACTWGDECCGGYCNGSLCGGTDGLCSDEFEPCMTPADCCDASMACLAGRCAQASP